MRPGGRPRLARRRAWTRIAAFGVAAGVLATMAAIGVATTAPASAADDDSVVFTVGMTGDVDSFNPFNGIEATSYEMWALMYDYMISYSMDDMSPEPGLAESWDTSDDGLTWTFHIRTGVKWSDGEDLTADDIAFTYNRILDGGPEAASWRAYLASVDTITAPDPETVVLKLESANAVLPLLPIPIVPEHIWKDVSEDEMKGYTNEPENEDSPPVGSGPFRLIEGQAGGPLYRFVPNPDYWQGASPIDELNFRVYKAEDPLVQALKKGEIDFADGIGALQVQALQGQPGITAQMGDSPSFDEIAFNVGYTDPKTGELMGDPNPAVQDPAFRFALNFAIDRDLIIQQAYQGAGDPGTTIIPPAYSGYRWEPDDPEAFAYDPEKAAQLLDEAGYTVGDDGFRTLPNGEPIGQLRLFARSDSETSIQVMNMFKEWLGDIDIDSEVTSVESNKLTNIILDGEYDTFEWGWYVEPDPDSMLTYLTCAQLGGWNDTWYCNKEFDDLYNAQHGELDLEKRQELVKQMQQILYEDAPYLVTTYSSIGEAYRSDRFHNFTAQPDPGGVWLFQYGVYNYLHLQPGPADDSGGSAAAGSSQGGISDTGQVIATMVGAVLLFALGGVIGGVAGYRKATVDYRE